MAWNTPGAVGPLAAGAAGSVLTVVFTDICGSTALTERLGDQRWVEVLSAHDLAVRLALAVHGGLEVKTVGDGFLAVFAGAAPAVLAGVDACRLVAGLRVPEVPEGLRIRVGVHTGPVIQRGDDVLGHTVHVARRITSAAAGGQVLVSAAAERQAGEAARLRAGAATLLHLRGVSEPQIVYAMDRTGDAAAGAGTPGGTVVLLADAGRNRHRPSA